MVTGDVQQDGEDGDGGGRIGGQGTSLEAGWSFF